MAPFRVTRQRDAWLFAQRSQRRRHLTGLLQHIADNEMHRKAVAAQQRQRIVRRRPDNRHARRAFKRQHAIIFKQRQGTRRYLTGDAARVVALQHDVILIGVRMLKQPKTEFLCQHARDNFIDFFHRYQPAFQRLRQMARAVIFRQLDIQTGVEGERRRVRRVLRHAVMLMQQTHAAVVGNNNAVEAPLFTQHFGEEEIVGVRRHVVDIVVSGHH